jgi:hypothetical protein
MKKIVLQILIYALVISAVLGIIIILLGLESEYALKVLCTTGLVFGFSIPGLCCSTIYEKEGKKELSTIGMSICAISCFYITFVVWTGFELFNQWEDNYKLISILILLSCSFGHISLLNVIKPKTNNIKSLINITVILSILIDILWIERLLIENDDHMKLDIILAILIALGTVVAPIMNMITKVEERESSKDTTNEIIHNSDIVNDEVIVNEAIDVSVVGEIKETNNNEDKYEKIEKLKKLLDMDAITQEEFEEEKKKLLD